MKTKIFALFLTVLMSLSALIGCAQVKKYTEFYGYGVKYLRTLSDSAAGIPKDTFAIPSQYRAWPHLAARDTTLFMWIPSLSYWKEITSTTTTPGGGGAAPRWGDITGLMTNQLDLRDSLEARQRKLPQGSSLQYWDAQGALRRFDSLLQNIGDTRYLKLADYEALGGSIDSNRFLAPLYEVGGDVYLDFGLPTYNANKLQGYLVHPGEPLHGSYLRFDSVDQRWEHDTATVKLDGGQIDTTKIATRWYVNNQIAVTGTTPTLQQVLDAGATMTANNSIMLNGKYLEFYNTSDNQMNIGPDKLYAYWMDGAGNEGNIDVRPSSAYIDVKWNNGSEDRIAGATFRSTSTDLYSQLTTSGPLNRHNNRVRADSTGAHLQTYIGTWRGISVKGHKVYIDSAAAATGTNESGLVIDNTTGEVRKGTASGGDTRIWDTYNTSDTLTAARTVSLDANTLSFTATGSGALRFNGSAVQGINTNFGVVVIDGNNTNGTNPWNDKALVVNGNVMFADGGFGVYPSLTSGTGWLFDISDGGVTLGRNQTGTANDNYFSVNTNYLYLVNGGGDINVPYLDERGSGRMVLHDHTNGWLHKSNYIFEFGRTDNVPSYDSNSPVNTIVINEHGLFLRLPNNAQDQVQWKRILWSAVGY